MEYTEVNTLVTSAGVQLTVCVSPEHITPHSQDIDRPVKDTPTQGGNTTIFTKL